MLTASLSFNFNWNIFSVNHFRLLFIMTKKVPVL